MSKPNKTKKRRKGTSRWKQFGAFVHKEFIHILRDPYTLGILLLMPIVEMFLFGFALNMEVTNIRTMVIDYSGDRYSQQIIEKIRHQEDFIFGGVGHDIEEVDALMNANKLDLAIVIPAHFEKDITLRQPTELQIIVDGTDPNAAKIAYSYTATLVATVLKEDFGFAEGEIPFQIDVDTRMLYNPAMHSSYNFVPGVMGLVLIVLCTIMTSVSIAREKERGSMELLLASPAQSTVMVLSKSVPYFVLSLFNLASILLISYFTLKVPIRGSLLLIILITMLYIFLSLAIGLAISSISKSQRDAIMISGFSMMMPAIVMGGMLFPIESMPPVLQGISYIIPARFYIAAIRKVMIQGLSFIGVWQEVLALAIMTVLTLTVAILNLKPRLQR